VCRDPGWRAVDPPGKSKDLDLPPVNAGDPATAADTKVLEGKTRPPRPHTDATLLHGMETAGKDLDDAELARAMRHAGLGTPATRADILQTLIDREYVVRQQRDLRATDKGRALIDAIPVAELKSAELTGRWEAHLSAVAEGTADRPGFMRAVVLNLRDLVRAIAGSPPPPPGVIAAREGPILGDCPKCGKPVRESRMVYDCEGGRECGFVVFKTMAKREVSLRMVKQLLHEGKTPVVKGWRSKEGKDFSAGLVWQEDRVRFHFAPREEEPAVPKEARPSRKKAAPIPASPVGIPCPRCGEGRIIAGRSAWGCDRWREGCRFTVPFEENGRRLTDSDAVRRIAG
jgi:DNA topoisomerase-3